MQASSVSPRSSSQSENLACAVDGGAFFVAGDQEADRSGNGPGVGYAVARYELPGGRGEGSDSAFHVGRAAPVKRAVDDLAGKRIPRPVGRIARRHYIGVPGKTEVSSLGAEPGVEVFNVGRVGIGKTQPVTVESGLRQRITKNPKCACVVRSHAGTADQGLGQRNRVVNVGHRLWVSPGVIR